MSAPPDPGALPADHGSMEFAREAEGANPVVDQLAQDMAARWRRGERPLAEEYINRHPDLRRQPEAAIDLIYEELCLRQEHNVTTTADELFARFPEWRDPLEFLLHCHQLLAPAAGPLSFPAPGEMLGEFELLAELGRGARGRVFLAAQPSLAGRLVVLKLTPCDGGEHVSLARLQHSHIVPLYSVQDDPGRRLRVLCMPWFGGTTLAWLLHNLADLPPERRTGRHLLDGLDRTQASTPVPLPPRGEARQYLGRAGYVQAICWLGACLADALHYAHERGLVHLDVKPSNVLLAADAQPMLLDFHLARDPISPAGALVEWVGGTLTYMSPEQQAALEAVRQDRQVPLAVDGRSDIYSLGLLLYEALGGKLPLPPGVPPRLDHCNRQVSVGLADLIHKCLAPKAGNRYPDAAALAADLRRHLTDQGLKGVPNRSWAERWRKWRRRRPHALRLLNMGLAVLLIAAALGVVFTAHFIGQHKEARELLARGRQLRESGQAAQAVEALQRARALAESLPFHQRMADTAVAQLRQAFEQQLEEVRGLLDQGRRQADRGQHADAVATLQRGLALARTLPAHAKLTQAFDDQLRLTERAEDARQLHALVNRLRFLAAERSPPARPAWAVMEPRCRAFWDRRVLLTSPDGPPLPSATQARLREDLLDLAVLWTDLRITLAENKATAVSSLEVLAAAQRELGPSRVIDLERRRHAQALGLPAAGEMGPASSTALEHCAVGRSLLRVGNLAEAASELRQAVRARPGDLWPNFYAGVCAFRQERYDEAIREFSVCVALAPAGAPCYFNRALAYTGAGHPSQALADYDQALELDPTLASAALNRGILHFQRKRYQEATADLRRALNNGADPDLVQFNLALVYRAAGDRNASLASVEAVLRHNPDHVAARELLQALKRQP